MSDERKELLVQGFKENAKKSSLTDSLKEGLSDNMSPKAYANYKKMVRDADDFHSLAIMLKHNNINPFSDKDRFNDMFENPENYRGENGWDIGLWYNYLDGTPEGDEFYQKEKRWLPDRITSRVEGTPIKEDTVKQGSSWVNKGKEGTHGKFKTKKGADAQRKAMFANGYKEGLKESEDSLMTRYYNPQGLKPWRGCKSIKFKWNGTQSDPDLIYKGYVFNYYDIEEALWDMFLEYNELTEKDVYDGYNVKPEFEAQFNDFVCEEAPSYCDDYIANGAPKNWHDRYRESVSRRKGKKLTEAPIYDLRPQYDSRKSFYGKAKVDTGYKNDENKLYSYGTLVAEIKDGKPVVYETYSATTLRHIKDWLRQNGFKADSAKQIMADYGTKDEALTEKRGSKEVKDSPFDYERRLLARLKSDCDYTLGACKDNGSSFEGVQKHFWAGNSGNQIAKMRELHQLSKDMDDIVTDSDIDTYEKRFRDWSKQEALTEASDGSSVENEFKNYKAFASNFKPITIIKRGKEYFVYKKGDEPKDGEDNYIQHGSKEYIDGWLYGAVQAKMKKFESFKSKGGKKPLTEGLSYGEMAAIEDEWAKYKERQGIKGFADADVALAFIEEECAEVYPTQDEQDEIFTLIGCIEEDGEYDESLKEGKKINIYKNGDYAYSTNKFSRVKDAVADARKSGKVKVASIPDKEVEFSDKDKVTGKFVRESCKAKKGKKPLKEGTSNFYSMDEFPLLIFEDYEYAWECADRQAREEIESDYDNMTDEEIEAYEEDAFNDPRYEKLLDKAFDENFDYCILDEE